MRSWRRAPPVQPVQAALDLRGVVMYEVMLMVLVTPATL